jgi:hypothetical protein
MQKNIIEIKLENKMSLDNLSYRTIYCCLNNLKKISKKDFPY